MKQAFVRSFFLSAMVFTAAMLLPSLLVAQEVVAAEVVTTAAVAAVAAVAPVAAASAPVAVSGPRTAQVGISRSTVATADMQQEPYRGTRSDVAWMTVGGVALVAGLIIGGDVGTVFAVSGAVIGLVGLFRYMN